MICEKLIRGRGYDFLAAGSLSEKNIDFQGQRVCGVMHHPRLGKQECSIQGLNRFAIIPQLIQRLYEGVLLQNLTAQKL